jgi:hypothetical protein
LSRAKLGTITRRASIPLGSLLAGLRTARILTGAGPTVPCLTGKRITRTGSAFLRPSLISRV